MAQSANMDASELARDIAAGLASATTATERAALVPAELIEAIQQLKTQRDAVILAHYYVAPEVQAVADYVGDSFYLAKLAKSLPQQTIVLCGVEFMGESAKLLNPTKTVLLPEPGADCPMAHMVKRETVDAARAEYGDDLAVVCYVNSTVEIKSWSDVCVTSSNAVKIVSELPQQHVLFIPDQNLGRFVAEQVPQKHVILNNGYCRAITSSPSSRSSMRRRRIPTRSCWRTPNARPTSLPRPTTSAPPPASSSTPRIRTRVSSSS